MGHCSKAQGRVCSLLSFFNDYWRNSEMFITPAFSQSAGGLAEGGFGLLPIVFVMVIFYFLLIRPQQKRAKQHKEMLAAIRRGEKIVPSGGLTGTIVKVVEDSETGEVEIAKDVSTETQLMMRMFMPAVTGSCRSWAAIRKEPHMVLYGINNV